MKNLNVEAGHMHPNFDDTLNFWTKYHLNVTKSQDQSYCSMILYRILPNKLLTTEHYKNITYQEFRQILNEIDFNFLEQIFKNKRRHC